MGKFWAGLLTQGFCLPLSSVQCFSDTNQMNTHNLAIVFGPTLFQTDGQDYKAGRVVEDLIGHYVVVFSVRPQPAGSGGQGWASWVAVVICPCVFSPPRWMRKS